jgi:molecular chaperone GrpE (heat shock protein)
MNDELDDNLVLPSPVPATGPEPAVSRTATQLIKLRDKVLLSRTDDAPPSPDLLDAIYRDLGRVLEAEGVTPIEDDGAFDYNRHTVIETRATSDPAQNNRICGTVRPGYLFDGRLVRAQEVVVFALERGEKGSER